MKKDRINPFLIIYLVALSSLAAVGYYVVDYQIASEQHKAREKQHFASDMTTYDLPSINMIISSSDKSGHMRMDLSLEVTKDDVERLKDYQPRIVDRLVSYMRQQDIEEIRPPTAMNSLRKHLMQEITLAS